MHTHTDIEKARVAITQQRNILLKGIWVQDTPHEPGSGCLIVRLPKQRELTIRNPLALRAIAWSILTLGWLDPEPMNDSKEEKERTVALELAGMRSGMVPQPLCYLDTSGKLPSNWFGYYDEADAIGCLEAFCMTTNDELFTSGNDAVEVLEHSLFVLKEYEASL